MNDSDVLNLIKSRRTCYKFLDAKEHPVNRVKLMNAIEAAAYAPNHKLTQPWRFIVLGKSTRQGLAEIYADNRSKKQSKGDLDHYQCFYDKALEKFSKIPLVVMVAQVKHSDPVVSLEDYAACSCAIQNFQIMAWQQNMGVQWSTGPIINDQRSYDLLSVDASQMSFIGALYIGNIDQNCIPSVNKKLLPTDEICTFTD